jgi:hypothetical protein
MSKLLLALSIALLVGASHTSIAQNITNTSNTVTFDLSTSERDCPNVPGPGSGTYQLDITWFDMNIGDWIYLNGLTATVTVNAHDFTIDASAVTPAVNFPPDEFINTFGSIVLTQPGFEYKLFWQIDQLNCTPLGIQSVISKPFIRIY